MSGSMPLVGVDDVGMEDAAARAVAALRAGGAVVLPTDTVYGLAVLPGGEAQLRALKGRPETVPIAVLVADAEQAWTLATEPVPEAAQRLAAAWWPGPLTLVVAARAGGTIGVRCPASPLLRAIAAEVGPVATTSANRHGEPTPAAAVAAAQALTGSVALVLDGGECGGVASTVVDVSGDHPVVLREGPVASEDIAAALL